MSSSLLCPMLANPAWKCQALNTENSIESVGEYIAHRQVYANIL